MDVGAASIYVSPTEKLFEKLQMNKGEAQREVTMKERNIFELEQSYRGTALARSAKGQGALCTKCHNSGHNRRRCTFATFISATICGDIKRHPDENKYLKDQREGVKKLKAKSNLTLRVRKRRIKLSRNTFAAQVQTHLINSDHSGICIQRRRDILSPTGCLLILPFENLNAYATEKFPQNQRFRTC